MKEQALYNFWASFGVEAYEEHSVPEYAMFPYITYQVVIDSFERKVLMTNSLWYRSTSWEGAMRKAKEIGDTIGRGGKFVSYDDGAIWICRGNPFSQPAGDESDDMIKRELINIEAEYLSAN